MIYFLVNEKRTAIKIGFTNNPKSRKSGVQTGNHNRLSYMRLIVGTRKDEKQLHHLFKNHRIRGEWFKYCADIIRYINSCSDKCLLYTMNIDDGDYIAGNLIKYHRKNQFKSLSEIGDMMGITAQSIKEMEDRELNKSITLKCLDRVAGILGCRLEYRFVPVDEIRNRAAQTMKLH